MGEIFTKFHGSNALTFGGENCTPWNSLEQACENDDGLTFHQCINEFTIDDSYTSSAYCLSFVYKQVYTKAKLLQHVMLLLQSA